MFVKLTSVSGVGPKVAMSLLSGMRLETIAAAIICEDWGALSKVKGIGKKTAERIVLELREKVFNIKSDNAQPSVASCQFANDAILALRGLGIGQAEAQKAVEAAGSGAKSVEELISQALKRI
jgi:Holliday junction DNA helicase RuvA